MKETLCRNTQETLKNITKYARAQCVEVKLTTGVATLSLYISDDGASFDMSQSFSGHLGLHAMRERADKAGGTFALTSAPNARTRIQVQIPQQAR